MWLEWILDECSELFSKFPLWMEELQFLDESMEEDVFIESIYQNDTEGKTFVDTIYSAKIPTEEAVDFDVSHKDISREERVSVPVWDSGNIASENIDTPVVMEKEVDSIWKEFDESTKENMEEEEKNTTMWAAGFFESKGIEYDTKEVSQKSVLLEKLQLEQKIEHIKEEASKEETQNNTTNETKIVENTSTEIDINVLMEAFEKKLWTARQKGGSRLIQR